MNLEAVIDIAIRNLRGDLSANETSTKLISILPLALNLEEDDMNKHYGTRTDRELEALWGFESSIASIAPTGSTPCLVVPPPQMSSS